MSNEEERTYRLGVVEKLNEIHEQVKKTNGRVSSLENWRWFISGGIAVMGVMIVPIFLAIVNSYFQ